MPKAKRTLEEVEEINNEMLLQAAELIYEEGYQGFSMRKLAKRLGIAAKTIYNYYHSQDEIYLSILTQGFEQLYAECLAAQQSDPDPFEQLKAMVHAYLAFGLENPNLYNLMFTWVVPKFNDYVDTELESVARIELEAALKSPLLLIESIKAYAVASKAKNALSDDEARIIMIQFWTQAHGYVSGINNTLIDYMHPEPLSLKETMVEAIFANLDRN